MYKHYENDTTFWVYANRHNSMTCKGSDLRGRRRTDFFFFGNILQCVEFVFMVTKLNLEPSLILKNFKRKPYREIRLDLIHTYIGYAASRGSDVFYKNDTPRHRGKPVSLNPTEVRVQTERQRSLYAFRAFSPIPRTRAAKLAPTSSCPATVGSFRAACRDSHDTRVRQRSRRTRITICAVRARAQASERRLFNAQNEWILVDSAADAPSPSSSSEDAALKTFRDHLDGAYVLPESRVYAFVPLRTDGGETTWEMWEGFRVGKSEEIRVYEHGAVTAAGSVVREWDVGRSASSRTDLRGITLKATTVVSSLRFLRTFFAFFLGGGRCFLFSFVRRDGKPFFRVVFRVICSVSYTPFDEYQTSMIFFFYTPGS